MMNRRRINGDAASLPDAWIGARALRRAIGWPGSTGSRFARLGARAAR